MSLRAIADGRYYKNGAVVLRYRVQGPKTEVDEYVQIMSARQNRTPEQWAKHANGDPFFFYPLSFILNNGSTPQPQYGLVKNFDGTTYNLDTEAQEKAHWAKVTELQALEEAKIGAQIKYGIIRPQRGPAAPAPTPATTTPATVPAEDTVLEGIKDAIGEESEPAQAAATGTLAD